MQPALCTGVQDTSSLQVHFRNRLASLEVEHRRLVMRLSTMHRKFFDQRVDKLLREAPSMKRPGNQTTREFTEREIPDLRSYTAELSTAEAALKLVVRSQADAAARLARLSQQGSVADESDWAAVTMHACSRGAADLLSLRVVDRLMWMPFSHHVRFPVYEQVGHCS